MNEKILVSLMLIGLISLVIGSTYSFFSDIETSEDNSFIAGTLNLQVGDEDPSTVKFTIQDLKPGDSGRIVWNVKNTGSLSGNFSVTVSAITSYENERIEPEEDAGDTTTGTIQGELRYYLKVSIWLDMDKNGEWSDGDIAFKVDKGSQIGKKVVRKDGKPATPPQEYFYWYGGRKWKNLVVMKPYSDFNFVIDYEFSSTSDKYPYSTLDDDVTQTDSCIVALAFLLKQ